MLTAVDFRWELLIFDLMQHRSITAEQIYQNSFLIFHFCNCLWKNNSRVFIGEGFNPRDTQQFASILCHYRPLHQRRFMCHIYVPTVTGPVCKCMTMSRKNGNDFM